MHGNHEHHHHDEEAVGADRTLALLGYMVTHNKSHAEELAELAASIEGEPACLIHEALAQFNEANELLDQALNLLKGE